MSNHESGHRAEARAADYLAEKGFSILTLNWKTPLCEIDIVAEKQQSVYFVEVKSRKTPTSGSGFDYVTPKKLKQMIFAANTWVAANNYHGDYRLAAISIDDEQISFVDTIDL